MSYATVADARAEGVPTPQISDLRIQAALDLATQLIDRITRQFFEPRTLTVDLDGTDGHILHLPFPIISVTAIYINNEFTSVSPIQRYRIYNGRGGSGPDDRKNPKIAISTSSNSIYEIPRLNERAPVFIKGAQNQRISGVWGYTEPDGSTPLLIKRACLKLAVRSLALSPTGMWGSASSTVPASGFIQSETTDGHSITYGQVSKSQQASGLTGDAEVDTILAMYRGPIGIRVPGSVYTYKG